MTGSVGRGAEFWVRPDLSWRWAVMLAVVGLLLPSLPLAAQADQQVLIFDGGAPSGSGGLRISFGSDTAVAASDFVLAEDSTLDLVRFWTREYPTMFSWTGVVNYWVLADDGGRPGAVVSSGSTADVVKTRDAQYDAGATQTFNYVFDVEPGIALSGGTTYWLALNLPATGGVGFSESYWAASAFGGGATSYRTGDPDFSWWVPYSYDLAFQLYFVDETVLEVDSDTVLTSDHEGAVVVTADNVTLDCAGFSVTPAVGSGPIGIIVANRTDVTVTNCRVSGWELGIFYVESSFGTITGNVAFNNSQGVALNTTDNTVVYGNEVYENSTAGIGLANADQDNTISQNYAHHNDRAGIDLFFADRNTVVENIVKRNGDFGILLNSANENQVRENISEHNGLGFFVANGSTDNQLTQNVAEHNEIGFLFANHSNGNTVSENVARTNQPWDAFQDDTSSNFFYENDFKRVQLGAGEIVGESTVPIPLMGSCGDVRWERCESLLGDVVTDAVRAVYGTDFAFYNSAAFRADLTCPTTDDPNDSCPPFAPPNYPITVSQLAAALFYDNHVFTVEITGAELKAILEHGVSAMPEPVGFFPQVSGLCFTYDIDADPGRRIASVVRQDASGACTTAEVDLSADSTYTLAQNSFTAGGGGGYPNFISQGRGEMQGSDREALRMWLADKSPISPSIDGRIDCEGSELVCWEDVATLDQGASIEEYSSRLTGSHCTTCADPRDVIGGNFSEYGSGETGNFIFGDGDTDQYIVVDLGQVRPIKAVGAAFSDLDNDREVFDFIEILVSLDGVTFDVVDIVGIKGVGDAEDFTLTSPVTFLLESVQDVRYVRYNFGQHSPDHGGGGSRILDVFAYVD